MQKEALERVSFLVTFGRNKFSEMIQIIVKTYDMFHDYDMFHPMAKYL